MAVILSFKIKNPRKAVNKGTILFAIDTNVKGKY
jgi:hypothetical protein